MRTAITLGRKKSDKTFRLLAGPEVAIREQLSAIKGRKYSDLDEVQIWSSAGGLIKKARPSEPKGVFNKEALLPIEAQTRPADEEDGEETSASPEEESSSAPAAPESPGAA